MCAQTNITSTRTIKRKRELLCVCRLQIYYGKVYHKIVFHLIHGRLLCFKACFNNLHSILPVSEGLCLCNFQFCDDIRVKEGWYYLLKYDNKCNYSISIDCTFILHLLALKQSKAKGLCRLTSRRLKYLLCFISLDIVKTGICLK